MAIAADDPPDHGTSATVMNVLTALHARRSHAVLIDPGPGDNELRDIIAAAAAAPDHGRHRPWRFVVIRAGGRAAFGDVLAEAYHQMCERDNVPPEPARAQRERAKPMRAPVIIAVACTAGSDIKVPRHERLASTAAATQNLLLAAAALGYGAMWRTGWPAGDPYVKTALGLADGDAIVSFVYVGTVPAGTAQPPTRRNLDGLLRIWP
ncbi:MAG: nitroreductase family protein [Actinobacteria bacterium]|nr:nitroreductase family protein [Actinomycetota bacterium]